MTAAHPSSSRPSSATLSLAEQELIFAGFALVCGFRDVATRDMLIGVIAECMPHVRIDHPELGRHLRPIFLASEAVVSEGALGYGSLSQLSARLSDFAMWRGGLARDARMAREVELAQQRKARAG